MISSTLKQLQFRLLNMDTLGERLREVMRELEIVNPKALADFCGVSEGLVSQWFSGQTKLGPKPLKAFSKTHFNLEWIVSGEPPKYRKDEAAQRHYKSQKDAADIVTADEIIELITAYKDASREYRTAIMNSAKVGAERTRRKRDKPATNEA